MNIETSPQSVEALTHIDFLRQWVRATPSKPLFKFPVANTPGEWRSVTYTEFYRDAERLAHYWRARLGLKQGDVVTVWFVGSDQADVTLLVALWLCDYTVQLISHQPLPLHASKLVESSGAKALIFAKQFIPPEDANGLFGKINYYHQLTLDEIQALPSAPNNAHPLPEPRRGDVGSTILHTSGTTGGYPKIVPLSHTWQLNSTKNFTIDDSEEDPTNVVRVWFANMANLSTMIMFTGVLRLGGTLVQSRVAPLQALELPDIIEKTGLVRFITAGGPLSGWLAVARKDPRILHALQRTKAIWYTGIGISPADYDWARQNGIPVVSLFAGTETAPMLRTGLDGLPTDRYFRELPGNPMLFQELHDRETSHEHNNYQKSKKLYELVVPATSPTAPIAALCDPLDGHYHTNDIFEEYEPGSGLWEYKGRRDNFFKIEIGWEVNAGYIEDTIRTQSPDALTDVSIIGPGRPYLTVLLEPRDSAVYGNHEREVQLKQEILTKQAPFNATRFPHEQITRADRMVFVKPGSMPRSLIKGTVMRKELEKIFFKEIEELYGAKKSKL